MSILGGKQTYLKKKKSFKFLIYVPYATGLKWTAAYVGFYCWCDVEFLKAFPYPIYTKPKWSVSIWNIGLTWVVPCRILVQVCVCFCAEQVLALWIWELGSSLAPLKIQAKVKTWKKPKYKAAPQAFYKSVFRALSGACDTLKEFYYNRTCSETVTIATEESVTHHGVTVGT